MASFRKYLIVSCSVMMLFTFVLTTQTLAEVYQDDEYYFSIRVPDDWGHNVITQTDYRDYAFSSQDTQIIVMVRVFEVTPGTTTNEVATLFESNVIPQANRLRLTPTNINGMPGLEGYYRGYRENVEVVIKSYLMVNCNIAYIVWSFVPSEWNHLRGDEPDPVMASFTVTKRISASVCGQYTIGGEASRRPKEYDYKPRDTSPPQNTQWNYSPSAKTETRRREPVQTTVAGGVKIPYAAVGDQLVEPFRLASPKKRFTTQTPEIIIVFKWEGSPSPYPFEVKWIRLTRDYVLDTVRLDVRTGFEGWGKTGMKKPDVAGGWPVGDYAVRIFHAGRLLHTEFFSVVP